MQCSPNTITANFSGGRLKAKTAWRHQWDHGQVLCVTGIDDLPLTFTAHFSVHKEYGAAQPVEGIDGQVTIPDIWLTFGKTVYCWIYLTDGESGETVYTITIPVIPRPMPEYYEMEDTGVFDEVVAQVGGYAESANDAATRAAASAEAAAGSASAAAESATAADTAAQNAAQSASGASTSATAANTAKDAAEAAQTAAESAKTAAVAARRAAETAAQDAQAASSAAYSASTFASTSASEAQDYASRASLAESNAMAYASSASSSANIADNRATAATNAATTATTQAEAAEAAKTAAVEAKTAAQSAQSAAETAASGASQSATAAAGSATAAAGSATAAAGSASGAAQSKTDAEAAATRAEQAAATLTVDDALSDTSVNPVQNKVITGEVTQLKNALDTIDDQVEPLVDLPGKVDMLERVVFDKRYGVSGIGQSASALTRLWDSVGMTAQVGTDGDNSSVVNDFDKAAPFMRRKCVGEWSLVNGKAVFTVNAYYGDADYTEDGTKGDYVAVECPLSYYYYEDGVLGVSAYRHPGYRPFDIFCRDHDPDDVMTYCYLPAYALAQKDGKAVSLPGFDNVQGSYKHCLDAARTYKSGALGTLAVIQPAAVNFYEWALFTVEFAVQNCQSIMQGCCSLRHDANTDRVTFRGANRIMTNNYQAARVAGEYIVIVGASDDINAAARQATHKILSIVRCDDQGVESATGTHQLIEIEDLGKGYITYDTTGATEYRIGARPYRTGSCNGVSTPSGSPVSNSDGYHPMQYRWRENVFGNQYKTVVDLFNEKVGTGDSDWMLEHYYLLRPQDYTPSGSGKPDATDLATDKFVKLDVETAHENYVNGYIKSKQHSAVYPDIWIPYETAGGSASTYYADYAYLVSSHAVRAVRLGGYWYSGANAGFSIFAGIYAPSYSYANYGGDLCFIQDLGGESAA